MFCPLREELGNMGFREMRYRRTVEERLLNRTSSGQYTGAAEFGKGGGRLRDCRTKDVTL